METIQAIGLALMITGAIMGIAGNLPPLYDIIHDAVTSWLSSKNSSMGSDPMDETPPNRKLPKPKRRTAMSKLVNAIANLKS